MISINVKNILLALGSLLYCCCISAQAPAVDITVVTEPATNPGYNNGKMTITIDLASATAPYVISITALPSYTYSTTTSNSVTTITGLLPGHYSGTIVASNGCTAQITAQVQKCTVTKNSAGKIVSVMCDGSTPDPGGGVKEFYTTGHVNTFVNTVPSDFTFQAFHSLPAYLYDQIKASVEQTMIYEITNLVEIDYSPFEILEQDEFQADAPYIFSFHSDGSLIWVYRNKSAELQEGSARNSDKMPEKMGRLFPNPTSGLVYVPIAQIIEDQKLSYLVVNSIGQTVLSNAIVATEGTEFFTFDLTTMPTGLYFVKVIDPDGSNHIFAVSKVE